ncbi:MAG: glycosyltransferase family 4 protein [Alphaproteobacteria bacterium]
MLATENGIEPSTPSESARNAPDAGDDIATDRPKLLFVINEGHFFMWSQGVAAKHAQDAGFEIHVAAPDDHVWAATGYSNDDMREHGFHFHALPLSRRGVNPLEDLRTLFQVYRLMRRLRPSLVHVITIKAILYGGLSARLMGVPTVATVAGLGHLFTSTQLSMRLLRSLVLRFYKLTIGHRRSRIICLNPADEAQMIDGGVITSDRMHRVGGAGVDLIRFQPRPKPSGDADGAPVAILPARLIWEKGVDDFVEAARLLRQRGVAVRFALVGDTHPSNPRAVPEESLRAWHEESLVEWWGRREDMDMVMAEADMVCLPSRYGEGLPTVLAEAAASARPCIASDIPGCREAVVPGETGLLVPPGDVARLADAIESLALDPARRADYGAAGRRLAEARFSDAAVARDHLTIYRAVLAQA